MDITGNAFVTGGGSGIGKAVCLALAKEGASGILVVDMNPKAAEATVVEVTSVASNPDFRAEAFQADISIEDSVKMAVAYMVKSFGRIDYGVHCAGIIEDNFVPVDQISFPVFQATISSQVHGTFLVIGQILAAMKTQEIKLKDSANPQLGGSRGSIAVLGSILSHTTVPGMGAYTAGKHAILGICRTAAVESASIGIRVNCICPTFVDTPMYYKTTEAHPGFEVGGPVQGLPMDRICTPKEVADTILFLCSPRSSFITGVALNVDGGHTLAPF